jgi:hypothetical protein
MKNTLIFASVLFSTLYSTSTAVAGSSSGPAITIYNQNFAVVRMDLPLELKKGVQQISYDGATAHIETDSVVLRDPTGKVAIDILEQNYEANVMSQALLLSLNEGKSIDFLVNDVKGSHTVSGKIIRGGSGEPIIESEGKLRFGLPGLPLFPTFPNGALLKPTLIWSIESATAAKVNAELAYLTSGMSWEATYNIVSPEKSNELDLIGWITMNNQSGRDFEAAKIKLMAGDVSKIQDNVMVSSRFAGAAMMDAYKKESTVTEKSFDEFHLYTLGRSTTLKDQESKQVEFVHAAKVQSELVYIYDGAATEMQRYQGWDPVSIRQDQSAGSKSQPKVWTMREFKNSKTNQLGIPLPKGKLRFYRRDDDGRLEFTGENVIDHTPKDETVRVYTGNAFDLVGERKRTNYRIDLSANWVDESFEITLKNRKDSDVEIRVPEKLFRWVNWRVTAKSQPFKKVDSQAIEFAVKVPKNSEKVVTYSVHYSW